MKKIILITMLLTATAFAKVENTTPQEIKVGVKGMVCAFCVQGIEKSFMKLPEVSKVEVSLEKKYVILKFKDGQSLPKEKIAEILKDAGYETVFGE